MPSAPPLPEFLTSRRHLAAAAVGLGVVAVLTAAATFAPAPVGAVPPVAATAATTSGTATLPDPATAVFDVPPVAAAATSARPRPRPTAAPTVDGPAITALAEQGIPIVALEAYRNAAAREARTRPSCHLAWTLVAAIGAVESGHGTHGGARLYADGEDLPHVIGPVLDGTAGNARIADTDKGVLDGDKVHDRAVGPMQFIPSTWAARGIDANGDGRADPFNIDDAAATTGDYLCRNGGDLATAAGRTLAVFSYNHLDSYVATVLALDAAYAGRPVTTTSPSPSAAPTAHPTRPAPRPTVTRPVPPASTITAPRPTPTPTTTCPTTTTTPTGSPTPRPTATPTGCPTPTTPAPSTPAPSTPAAPSTSRPTPGPSRSSATPVSAASPTPTPTG